MTREEFIQKHASLFWYTPEEKKKDIRDSLLVETILIYGTLDDFREMVSVIGLEHAAHVFFSAKGRQKGNYPPAIYNYFTLVFHRYAPQGNIK